MKTLFPVLAVVILLLSAPARADQFSIAPAQPTSVDVVAVTVTSDIGIGGTGRAVLGDVVRVFVYELAATPAYEKTATIEVGTLPPGEYTVEVHFVTATASARVHRQSLPVTKAPDGIITTLEVSPQPPLAQQTLSWVLRGLSGCGLDFAVKAWASIVNGIQVDVTYDIDRAPAGPNGCFPVAPAYHLAAAIGHFPPGAYTMIARGAVFGVRQPALKIAFTLPESPVGAIEYYHPAKDHYFVTANPAEIAKLDAQTYPGGWFRTHQSFGVTPPALPASNAVCRFYGKPDAGLDTHFFSASAEECAAVQLRFAQAWIFESANVFGVTLPNASDGACPAPLKPLHRLFNNRADANHRYTTSEAVRAEMIAKGWLSEGYGDKGVAMCVD